MRALIVLLVLLAAGMSWAFTWEGELDPNEFDKWIMVPGSSRMVSSETIKVTARNPDKEAEPRLVQMIVNVFSKGLLSYEYFKDGDIYSYFFNEEEDAYKRYIYSQEEKMACMRCHGDQLTFREAV